MLTTLNSFSNPFSLITNWGGDHHSPQRKRKKGEKYTFKESGHLLILILHCCDMWEDNLAMKKKKEKKKIYFLSNK